MPSTPNLIACSFLEIVDEYTVCTGFVRIESVTAPLPKLAVFVMLTAGARVSRSCPSGASGGPPKSGLSSVYSRGKYDVRSSWSQLPPCATAVHTN